MPDYKAMYCVLCKAVDDTVDGIESSAPEAADVLKTAQLEAEEIYIETAD